MRYPIGLRQGFTRNGVKQWLEEKNHQKPDDLIDGACEPLAYYLSSSISQLYLSSNIELSEDQESRSLTLIYEQVKNGLDQLEPRLAAEMIFGNYIKQEINPISTVLARILWKLV